MVKARIAAGVLACALAGLTIRISIPTWSVDAREALQRADAALGAGDTRGARRAWDDAYRAVMRSGEPEAMLEVGRFHVLIGETGPDPGTAVARARRLYLAALFQARERRDAHAVARAGEAFAALGDREVAERAFDIAMALAEQSRDAATRDRVAALRVRAGYPTRTR